MKYRAKQKIENYKLTETRINEEQLFRDLAFSIVEELPIDKLKELFNLKVIYGFQSDLDKAIKENNDQKIEQIQRLIIENASLITGEIYIPK